MLHLPLGNATWSCINKRFTVWLLSQPISLSGPQRFWSLHARIPWVRQAWSSVSSICTPKKFLRTKVMESHIFILFSNFKCSFPSTETQSHWPWTQHTMFFFFPHLQIWVIHKHRHASYQTHTEKHDHVFCSCFLCLLFLHNQDQVTYITYRCCTASLNPVVCWHGALYNSYKNSRN